MSPEKSSTAPLRGLFTAFKRMILPTAEAELPLIRHAELGTAEDEAAWRSEFDYLKGLASGVFDELIDGADVSLEFAASEISTLICGDYGWPIRWQWDLRWGNDRAAELIAEWRSELDGQAA